MSVKILLIRHGRSDFESRDFLESPRGRQWDPPLSEKGAEQARALSVRLELMDPPKAVIVSPFQRCRETIQPFLDATGMEARVVDDVGEVFIGGWEGLSFEEIVSGDEELARRFREQEAMFALAPGGESGRELRERVVPAIEEALAPVSDGVIVVVTHGGVINAYLGHVMGIEEDMFFLPENSSINTVEADGNVRRLRFLNDVRHLTDPQVFAPPAGLGGHAQEGHSASRRS